MAAECRETQDRTQKTPALYTWIFWFLGLESVLPADVSGDLFAMYLGETINDNKRNKRHTTRLNVPQSSEQSFHRRVQKFDKRLALVLARPKRTGSPLVLLLVLRGLEAASSGLFNTLAKHTVTKRFKDDRDMVLQNTSSINLVRYCREETERELAFKSPIVASAHRLNLAFPFLQPLRGTTWHKEEDEILKRLVEQYKGTKVWTEGPQNATETLLQIQEALEVWRNGRKDKLSLVRRSVVAISRRMTNVGLHFDDVSSANHVKAYGLKRTLVSILDDNENVIETMTVAEVWERTVENYLSGHPDLSSIHVRTCEREITSILQDTKISLSIDRSTPVETMSLFIPTTEQFNRLLKNMIEELGVTLSDVRQARSSIGSNFNSTRLMKDTDYDAILDLLPSNFVDFSFERFARAIREGPMAGWSQDVAVRWLQQLRTMGRTLRNVDLNARTNWQVDKERLEEIREALEHRRSICEDNDDGYDVFHTIKPIDLKTSRRSWAPPQLEVFEKWCVLAVVEPSRLPRARQKNASAMPRIIEGIINECNELWPEGYSKSEGILYSHYQGRKVGQDKDYKSGIVKYLDVKLVDELSALFDKEKESMHDTLEWLASLDEKSNLPIPEEIKIWLRSKQAEFPEITHTQDGARSRARKSVLKARKSTTPKDVKHATEKGAVLATRKTKITGNVKAPEEGSSKRKNESVSDVNANKRAKTSSERKPLAAINKQVTRPVRERKKVNYYEANRFREYENTAIDASGDEPLDDQPSRIRTSMSEF